MVAPRGELCPSGLGEAGCVMRAPAHAAASELGAVRPTCRARAAACQFGTAVARPHVYATRARCRFRTCRSPCTHSGTGSGRAARPDRSQHRGARAAHTHAHAEKHTRTHTQTHTHRPHRHTARTRTSTTTPSPQHRTAGALLRSLLRPFFASSILLFFLLFSSHLFLIRLCGCDTPFWASGFVTLKRNLLRGAQLDLD